MTWVSGQTNVMTNIAHEGMPDCAVNETSCPSSLYKQNYRCTISSHKLSIDFLVSCHDQIFLTLWCRLSLNLLSTDWFLFRGWHDKQQRTFFVVVSRGKILPPNDTGSSKWGEYWAKDSPSKKQRATTKWHLVGGSAKAYWTPLLCVYSYVPGTYIIQKDKKYYVYE